MAIVVTHPTDRRIQVTGGTSGTPATFRDVVTADRGGTYELLGAIAGADDLTLTNQIRPVEILALLIDFVVAGKSAEADYIHITGTDAWNGALSETIDVTAGNGTYTSTNRFRTITDIDCNDDASNVAGTEWADGTVQVIQNQWGLIWDLASDLTLGTGQPAYRLDCQLHIGDGTISSYFVFQRGIILINDVFTTGNWQTQIFVYASATLLLGRLANEATKELNGLVSIVVYKKSNYFNYVIRAQTSDAIILLYGATFTAINNASYYNQIVGGSVSDRYWHILGVDAFNFQNFSGDGYNITNMGAPYGIRYPLASGKIEKCLFINCTKATAFSSNDYEMRNVVAVGLTDAAQFETTSAQISNLIDCDFDSWDFIRKSGSSHELNRKYTVNMKVKDEGGNVLSGVTVDCQDTNDDYAWAKGTVTTDVNGDITEQEVRYIKYDGESAGNDITYSPHKFTFSLAGYRTLVMENITISDKIVWEIEMPQGSKRPAIRRHEL